MILATSTRTTIPVSLATFSAIAAVLAFTVATNSDGSRKSSTFSANTVWTTLAKTEGIGEGRVEGEAFGDNDGKAFGAGDGSEMGIEEAATLVKRLGRKLDLVVAWMSEKQKVSKGGLTTLFRRMFTARFR